MSMYCSILYGISEVYYRHVVWYIMDIYIDVYCELYVMYYVIYNVYYIVYYCGFMFRLFDVIM